MFKRLFKSLFIITIFLSGFSIAQASEADAFPKVTKYSEILLPVFTAVTDTVKMTQFSIHAIHHKDFFPTKDAMINELAALSTLKINEQNTLHSLSSGQKLTAYGAMIPLQSKLYLPKNEQVKGIVYAFPSRIGFDERVEATCIRYAEEGLAVITPTPLKSRGLVLKGGMGKFNALMSQLDVLFLHNALRESFEGPVFINATSMGSLIATGGLWQDVQDLFPETGPDFKARLRHVHLDSAVQLLFPPLKDGMFGLSKEFKGINIFQGRNDPVCTPDQLEYIYGLVENAQPSLQGKIEITSYEGFAHDFRGPKSEYSSNEEQMVVYTPLFCVLVKGFTPVSLDGDSLARLFDNKGTPLAAPKSCSYAQVKNDFNDVETNNENIYRYSPGNDSSKLIEKEMEPVLTVINPAAVINDEQEEK